MVDRIGQSLGDYLLIRLLGRGGFADVYLGEHSYLKSHAALKVLRNTPEREGLARFLLEAQILVRLIHPHIVRVLDFSLENGTPYLVMEYASGGTLRNHHPKGSRLLLETVILYVKQVAVALQYAHDRRLIHRDIKPENMFVGQNAEILLGDLGLALLLPQTDTLTTQEIAGTVLYMAPEQIRGKPCPASDQYALAAVVYEWLCGEPLFRGSAWEIVNQHLSVPPPALREQLPELSRKGEEVILKALAKDPQQRFPSVQAFATALEQACRSATRPFLVPSLGLSPEHAGVREPAEESDPGRTLQESLHAAPSDSLRRGLSRSLSRRTILGGLGVVTAGALLAPFLLFHRSPASATQSQRRSLTIFTFTGVGSFVAWSPDGRHVAAGGSGNQMHVWDTVTGKPVHTYPTAAYQVTGIAWSPDGKSLASTGQSGAIQIWDVATGTSMHNFTSPAGPEHGITWAPDSKHIATIGGQEGEVDVWETDTEQLLYAYSTHSEYYGYTVAWSPDGKYIAAGNLGTVQVWEAFTKQPFFTYRDLGQGGLGITGIAWSPDSKYVAIGAGDTTVQIWEVITDKRVYTYEDYGSNIRAVAWSPDGKRIAVAGRGGTVQVWDAFTGKHVYVYHGHSQEVFTVAWSPDSKHLASGDEGGVHITETVQIWQDNSM